MKLFWTSNGKPSYTKRSILTKDKDKKKKKRTSIPSNKQLPRKRHAISVRLGHETYNVAVKQKKKYYMWPFPKSINLSTIKRTLGRQKDIVILHVGIKDVMNTCHRDQVIKNMQQIPITCKTFNVKQVIISGAVLCKRANIYLLKVNDRNTRKRCEICSKLAITLNIFHTLF